jgi:hypothetical protein
MYKDIIVRKYRAKTNSSSDNLPFYDYFRICNYIHVKETIKVNLSLVLNPRSPKKIHGMPKYIFERDCIIRSYKKHIHVSL